MRKVYQVIECSGEWEDYHEWVVYTTFDRAKAEYIKRVLSNREAALIDRDKWECYYDPSWFRVDCHNVDQADCSEYTFLETVVKERGKLRSPIFGGDNNI